MIQVETTLSFLFRTTQMKKTISFFCRLLNHYTISQTPDSSRKLISGLYYQIGTGRQAGRRGVLSAHDNIEPRLVGVETKHHGYQHDNDGLAMVIRYGKSALHYRLVVGRASAMRKYGFFILWRCSRATCSIRAWTPKKNILGGHLHKTAGKFKLKIIPDPCLSGSKKDVRGRMKKKNHRGTFHPSMLRLLGLRYRSPENRRQLNLLDDCRLKTSRTLAVMNGSGTRPFCKIAFTSSPESLKLNQNNPG